MRLAFSNVKVAPFSTIRCFVRLEAFRSGLISIVSIVKLCATCKRLLSYRGRIDLLLAPFVAVASVRGSLAHHRELLAPFTLLLSRTAII